MPRPEEEPSGGLAESLAPVQDHRPGRHHRPVDDVDRDFQRAELPGVRVTACGIFFRLLSLDLSKLCRLSLLVDLRSLSVYLCKYEEKTSARKNTFLICNMGVSDIYSTFPAPRRPVGVPKGYLIHDW